MQIAPIHSLTRNTTAFKKLLLAGVVLSFQFGCKPEQEVQKEQAAQKQAQADAAAAAEPPRVAQKAGVGVGLCLFLGC